MTGPPMPTSSLLPGRPITNGLVVPRRFLGRGLAGLFFAQALLLSWVAVRNADTLNADAVAYLRLAEYYAGGKWQLAVSGYWGPLLSWLIALLLKCGLAPLVAARAVMALSALGFTFGAALLFHRLNFSRTVTLAATGLVALAAVSWSVAYISPDLLQAGLTLMALAFVLPATWVEHPRNAWWAGLFFGLAYLAKAVALPLGLATIGTVFVVRWGSRARPRRKVFVSLALTLSLCAVLAGPWIGVLSTKYGHLTFSTSARIAHAIVGPEPEQRYHPFARTFHRPEAGRVTAWEDPSRMAYRYWSPFASAAAWRHQCSLAAGNAITILELLGSLDRLWLGLGGALSGLVWLTRKTWRRRAGSWLWLAVPLGWLAGAYLPTYVQWVDQRYFYLAAPLLIGLYAGAIVEWMDIVSVRGRLASLLGGGLALVSFVVGPLAGTVAAVEGVRDPASRAAHELAARLGQAGLRGSIAGSALVLGGRAGLYVAYLTGQPWFGDAPEAGPDEWFAAGSDLVILQRKQGAVAGLDADPRFESLDARLFPAGGEAERFPLKAYRVRR